MNRKSSGGTQMNHISRWEPFRGLTSLQEQVNRLFDDTFTRSRTGESDLATWAPAVDIYETEQELVVKADLPGLEEKDIDLRVENNMLTIRGERKFNQDVSQDNYLRIERAYGTFTRSFSLPNTINPEGIRAEYQHGTLVVHMAKREESKPKQIKIAVGSNSTSAAASRR
jgi:HSP20 family protein